MLVGLAEGLCGGIPCSLGQDDESSDEPGENKQEEASVDAVICLLCPVTQGRADELKLVEQSCNAKQVQQQITCNPKDKQPVTVRQHVVGSEVG